MLVNRDQNQAVFFISLHKVVTGGHDIPRQSETFPFQDQKKPHTNTFKSKNDFNSSYRALKFPLFPLCPFSQPVSQHSPLRHLRCTLCIRSNSPCKNAGVVFHCRCAGFPGTSRLHTEIFVKSPGLFQEVH